MTLTPAIVVVMVCDGLALAILLSLVTMSIYHLIKSKPAEENKEEGKQLAKDFDRKIEAENQRMEEESIRRHFESDVVLFREEGIGYATRY